MMLLVFSLLVVYGGVTARAAHHIAPCANVTSDCASNPTCNTILTTYQTDCMPAFNNTGCPRACVYTAFKRLFTDPIGQRLHDCQCDTDACSNFTTQCSRCGALLTACAFDSACNVYYQDILAKCAAVRTGCDQTCTDSFNAAVKASLILAQLPECSCDAGDVVCEQLRNTLNRCYTTNAPMTDASRGSQAAQGTSTVTSTATQRSVAVGALVIGVVAGVLCV
ncbi:uncharacterized protein LOC134186868 [Corticium candelabrum]|uniref:uncharacterized protein LOC134186868 n=1 Tax=Corticium candelabrum TaxID=121492 RepID=UPI002E26B58B|nr:uncharacterized protein LOC134186868 [Corticium candelabrum]